MPQKLPEALERLASALSRLPTIGRKSAQRLAFHILKSPDEDAHRLARALEDVKRQVRFCRRCFFITGEDLCSICLDPARDSSQICVVEGPQDVVALEKSSTYKGLYHVLLGHLSPLHGVTAEDLKIQELINRIQSSSPAVREVVLATNPNVDGDATAIYLSRLIEPLGIQTTRLGLGLSIGSSLEYADELTLKKAFEGRRQV
ncbi:MAG: recombination mediator RecR [Candidatus Sumerlaeaceae bacterium]|nr:recombination mediator RecR [Candidatus Sumerlaeaceae bacterium]